MTIAVDEWVVCLFMWSWQKSLKVITHLKISAGWVCLRFVIVAFPGYAYLLFKKEPVHEQSQLGKSGTIRELTQPRV